MKNIILTFLPFFLFLFFTVVLFFFLKEDNIISNTYSNYKTSSEVKETSYKKKSPEVKEIFDDVRVKKNRDRIKLTSEVTRIRWSQHNGFERIVLDVYGYRDGSFTIGEDSKDRTKLHGTLKGYKAFSATLPTFINSSIVKDMQVYAQGSDSYNFTISLHRPVEYKVFALSDPSRIVIDLY